MRDIWQWLDMSVPQHIVTDVTLCPNLPAKLIILLPFGRPPDEILYSFDLELSVRKTSNRTASAAVYCRIRVSLIKMLTCFWIRRRHGTRRHKTVSSGLSVWSKRWGVVLLRRTLSRHTISSLTMHPPARLEPFRASLNAALIRRIHSKHADTHGLVIMLVLEASAGFYGRADVSGFPFTNKVPSPESINLLQPSHSHLLK